MTVKLNTRIVIMTNEVPRFSDSSNALAGRCLTLQTRRSFYGKEDTGLTERLLAELPGILNWALEGQRRLRQRGAFKQPKSSEELVQQLEELGSPMTCFVRECCEVMSGARVPSDELYQAWVGWCQREGRDHCGTKSTFGRDLLAAVATVKSRRDTTQRVFYDGICLSSASKPRRWINVSNGLAFFIHCVSDGGRGKSRVIVRGGGSKRQKRAQLWVTVGHCGHSCHCFIAREGGVRGVWKGERGNGGERSRTYTPKYKTIATVPTVTHSEPQSRPSRGCEQLIAPVSPAMKCPPLARIGVTLAAAVLVFLCSGRRHRRPPSLSSEPRAAPIHPSIPRQPSLLTESHLACSRVGAGWCGMKVEMWPVSKVWPYEQNPRNSDTAVDGVASSIKEFGFRQPIVVDNDGIIICGHTRLKAALKLGLKEVPVHVADELSQEQVRALRIADNKLHELSTWNDEVLAVELGELKELDVDLNLLGFSNDDLTAIFAPPVTVGFVDEDDVPEPPDAATTQVGDLWVMGSHRLLCGDSSSATDVDRLLDGAAINLVNTDPPYNVKVEPRSNNAIAAGLSSFTSTQKKDASAVDQQSADLNRYPEKSKPTHRKLRAKDRPLANDFVSDEEFDRLLDAWFGNMSRVLVPGGSFYIWGGYANCGNYPPVLKRHELYFSQAVIWIKEHPVLTRKDFMGNHEWCFYGWKQGAGHQFYGPNNVPDTWSVKKVNPQSMVHLTEKPVELAKRAIEYSSKSGENVLDLFGGSGSTLIAAEMTGRRAFLMELDPLYCDVIVQRWEKFTGKKAQRVASTTAQ